MGSFTSSLKLYKPDPTEFVDVNSQLNDNWAICDKQVRRLLEYELVTDNNPDVFQAIPRSRYYKLYSNSPMAYFPYYYYMDPGAFVSTWIKASSALSGSYIEHPDYPIGYRLIKKSISPTITEVEWTGSAWLNGSNLPLNTNTVFGILPSAAIPASTKYFTVNCGNASTSYSIARVIFSAGAVGTADMEFKRYGDTAGTDSGENRIDLTGIKYSLEVTAT